MVLTATGRSGQTGDEGKYDASKSRMTPEVLLAVCKDRKMWELPHLNVQLYLNHKGFSNIGGLENYSGVRTLHLGNNMIAKIEGLERMLDLRCLHLENNRISSLEGLETNLQLRQLNVESNSVKCAAGLSHLANLENLNLSRNSIERLEDLADLRPLAKLSNIDVSHNFLEVADGVVEFWTEFSSSLRLLRYNQNPGVRFVEHYRKRLINALPLLGYLDERPVQALERRSCKAWAEGGNEAMQQAKKDFFKERNEFQVYEPERGEVLHRLRKNAIARMDREAKEREEEEARLRSNCSNAKATTDLQAGDEAALASYMKTWQTKVALHGVDGVRASVAKEDAAAGGVAAGKVAGSTEAPRQHFAPPPRAAGPDAERGHVAVAEQSDDAPPPLAGSARRRPEKAVDAADFRVRSGAAAGEDASWDRQFQALGAEAWSPTTEGFGSSAAARGSARGRGPGCQGAPADEVMPLIWEQNREQNALAEMQCLEQSWGVLGGGGGGGGGARAGGADELSVLD